MSIGASAQLYVVANIVIGLGYLAVPLLVLPYIELRRRTVLFGTMFFIGCFGSHADMVWDIVRNADHHPAVGWVAALWHVVQAVGTWGFIIMFRQELAQADALLDRLEHKGAP